MNLSVPFRKPGTFCATLSLIVLPLGSVAAESGADVLLKKPGKWFTAAECRKAADHVLAHQTKLGGWPKNTATTKQPSNTTGEDLQATFDNGATTGEIRFLARCFSAAPDPRDKEAVLRGIHYILAAQYQNGGWPQFHPPGTKYHRYITFNDGSMVRIVELLREIAQGGDFGFVPAELRDQASAAFERGIQCILSCQIKVDGKLTVWCAQHDEIDFSPRAARTYELASLSGSESVGIARLLMSLNNPSDEVVNAIEAAAEWFEEAKLHGVRIASQDGDKTLVADLKAPPLWARFYDLESGKPVFADRDGVPKSNLAEIGRERRNGYTWYGTWPASLLEKDLPAWRKRNNR